ncbi:hypothetical protein ccbrp13_44860 [Ktedonobacteria bacterium brp13]|nr:hypothetical protein ccbrp13_44860 [Ktedonobacteria bacterium brp13]
MHDSSLADFSELDKEIEGVRVTARSQATWQKVVETPSRPPASHPPRPPRPPQSLRVLRNIPYGSPFRSVVFFWISLLLLLLAVCAGLFGLAVTFGRGPAFIQHGPSLSASPDIAPVGMKVSLHGLGFTPGGQVGFFRDGDIQLANVKHAVTMLADDQGNIANTVQISADWGGGEHTVMAEDASTHKIASFPIQIIGNMGPLRPAHLYLSTTSLDLGIGDQATNTMQTVALDNSGSGQIAWQGTTTQPWLMMSPRSGTLSAGQPAQITIAVNRYNLTPGNYTASVVFSSDAGNTTLNISMHVSPLIVGNEGILQLTPAVLAFDATDAGNNPNPQVVTVSNPGHASLSWQAKSSAAWLTLSQYAGAISPAHSSAVAISVHTATLLPGVYSADITFSAEGSALHSPQHVYVSITISPQCSVQVSPGMLSFNGTQQQGLPAVQTVGLTSSQSCTSPAHWSAHSTASWVTLGATGGTAPGSLNVGVNPAGLGAGPHLASVIFTSNAGSQVVPINFNLGSASAPELALGASALGFQGVLNGGNPAGQLLRVSNTGRGQLSWQASVQTNSGGNWLSLNATSGRLNPGQSIPLAVNAAILPSFVPGAYTYTGMVSVVGTDSAGHIVSGGPLKVPVSFKVSAACSVAVSSNVQTFPVFAGRATPATAAVNVTASNTCQHPISLSAVASTTSGGNWLSTLLSSNTLTSAKPVVLTMNAVSAALTQAAPYSGKITVTATDTVTHALLGVPQVIDVTLNVQPPCTLQAPSTGVLTFNEQPGAVTDKQTFTIGVVGTCNSGPVTIVPTALMQGPPWFTITATQVGTSTTFTVTVNMAQLTGTKYQGSISIAALEGGIAIVGSQQPVNINLKIASPPALSVSPVDGVSFDLNSGDSSTQTVNVSNVGGGGLDWTARLRGDAPAFLSLSTGAVSHLPGGSSTSFSLTVNTTGIPAGTTYSTVVLIDAQDSATTKALGGELSIPVTIQVTSIPVPTSSPTVTPAPTTAVTLPTVPVAPVISSVVAATPTVPPVTATVHVASTNAAAATTMGARQLVTTAPALTPARTVASPATVPSLSSSTDTSAIHKGP